MKITEIRMGKSVEVLQAHLGKRSFWYKVDLGADVEFGDSEDDCIDALTKKIDSAIERNLPPESEIGQQETTVTRGDGRIAFLNINTGKMEY